MNKSTCFLISVTILRYVKFLYSGAYGLFEKLYISLCLQPIVLDVIGNTI